MQNRVFHKSIMLDNVLPEKLITSKAAILNRKIFCYEIFCNLRREEELVHELKLVVSLERDARCRHVVDSDSEAPDVTEDQ